MTEFKKLSFEEWFNVNEEAINIQLIESGATREMDFDSEKEFDKRYEQYLKDLELAIEREFGPV